MSSWNPGRAEWWNGFRGSAAGGFIMTICGTRWFRKGRGCLMVRRILMATIRVKPVVLSPYAMRIPDPMPTLLAEESVNGAWCTIGIVHAWLRGSNLRSMATRLKDSGGGTYSVQFTVSAICSSSSGGNSFSFRATSMLITKAKSVMRATGRSPGTVPSTRMRSACWAASWPTS